MQRAVTTLFLLLTLVAQPLKLLAEEEDGILDQAVPMSFAQKLREAYSQKAPAPKAEPEKLEPDDDDALDVPGPLYQRMAVRSRKEEVVRTLREVVEEKVIAPEEPLHEEPDLLAASAQEPEVELKPEPQAEPHPQEPEVRHEEADVEHEEAVIAQQETEKIQPSRIAIPHPSKEERPIQETPDVDSIVEALIPNSREEKKLEQQVQKELAEVYKHPPQQRGKLLIEGARFAIRQGEPGEKKAIRMYHEALRYELTDTQSENTLMELANLYEKQGQKAKMAIIYEKFLDKFQLSSNRTKILLKMGYYYRDEAHIYDMAINKFYEIMDMTLSLGRDEVPVVRHLTTKAQVEIADTYYLMEKYPESIKLYDRIENLDLTRRQQDHVEFKRAYANYNLAQYDETIRILKILSSKKPESSYAPEALYVLANSYKNMRRLNDTMDEITNLISHKVPDDPQDRARWNFWKRKTANELANEFYEQEDYSSALKIYKTMAPLSNRPEWQWPVIYQMGRCFEQLRLLKQAKDSYELIVTGEEWEDIEFTMTSGLKSIRETAQWRLQNLEWLEKTEDDITSILNPTLPTEEANKKS